jgi:O-antigen ligase
MGGASGRPSARPVSQDTRPTALTVVCLLLIAVTFGRLHELYPATATLPVGKILLPVAGAVFLSQRDLRDRLRVLNTAQGIGFLILCAAIVLSIPGSFWPGSSVFEAQGFFLSALPYVLILSAALRDERDFDWAFGGLVFCTIALAGAMAAGMGINVEGRQAVSGTYDPNDIALAAVLTIPMAARFVSSRNRWLQLYGLAGTLSGVAVVGLSGSRGGALALAAVLLATLNPRAKSFSTRWRLLLIPTVLVGLASAPPTFWQRLQTLQDPSSDYNMTDEGGRIEIWKRGIALFATHPVLGVGFQQFRTANGMMLSQIKGTGENVTWHTAHNTLIQVSTELGVTGLAGLLYMFLPIFPQLRRRRKGSSPHDPALAIGGVLSASVVGFFVGAFFLSAGYSPQATTLAALGMAYARYAARGGGQLSPARPRRSMPLQKPVFPIGKGVLEPTLAPPARPQVVLPARGDEV